MIQPKLFKAKARPPPLKKLVEIKDRTTSKFIEKHEGKLTQQIKRPFQGNGLATISKTKKALALKHWY